LIVRCELEYAIEYPKIDGHAREHIAATKSMIAMQKTFHYAENEA
jgi:hypothetical protein